MHEKLQTPHECNPPYSDFKNDSELARIESALGAIPARDYTNWLLIVGYGLHHEFGGSEQGLDLWLSWSWSSLRYRAEKHQQECRRQWRFIKQDHANPVTVGSIFHLAKQHGWTDPKGKPSGELREPIQTTAWVSGRSNDLAARALGSTRGKFAQWGHEPSEGMMTGLWQIAKVIEAMAVGRCDPRFYVSSLAPGVGKTTVLNESVRSILADDRPEARKVGILLLVNRLVERI